MKRYIKIICIFLFCFLIFPFVISCIYKTEKTDETINIKIEIPQDWKIFDSDLFSIYLPKTWETGDINTVIKDLRDTGQGQLADSLEKNKSSRPKFK